MAMQTLAPLDYPKYSSLNHEWKIRILQLQPGGFEDDIECNLLQVDLRNPPTYAALSYVWGDPKSTDVVICNGQLTIVRANLKAALKRIRHPSEICPCWVDALCINQSDNDEKNKQVALMGEVYSRALNVVIYLGEEAPGFDAVCTIMHALRGASLDTAKTEAEVTKILTVAYYMEDVKDHLEDGEEPLIPPSRSAVWDGFQDFFRQEWFSRVWVFQEAILASPDPWVLYGERQLPWKWLASVARLYHSSGLRRARPTSDLSFHLVLMDNLRKTRHEENNPFDLLQLLRHTRKFKATNPRDKFFGLYGLTSERHPWNEVLFKPDYHASPTRVYCNIAAHLIVVKEAVDLLSFAGAHSSAGLADLPSWVPDWIADDDTADVMGVGLDDIGYNACLSRKLPCQCSASPDRRTLTNSGRIFDRIRWRSEVFGAGSCDMFAPLRTPGILPHLWKEQVQQLGPEYAGGGTISEAFWRTLIANIDEDRIPATAEHFIHFLSYWRLARIRDCEAEIFIRDGGVRPSYSDSRALRDAAREEYESNFYNQDQVDALKRRFKRIVSEDLGESCSCSDGIGKVEQGLQKEFGDCKFCRWMKDPPWRVVTGRPHPLRLDDPTMGMMDDPFIAEFSRRLRNDVIDPIHILDSSANV
jgi:hypothetical protein